MLSAKQADASISAMSRMLLQGYALLEQSCPACKVPLMRKRNEEYAVCVQCSLSFDREGQQVDDDIGDEKGDGGGHPQVPVGNEPRAKMQKDVAKAAGPGEEALEEFRRMREGTTEEQQERGETQRRDPADEIAARMLQGWALLGIHCPRCKQPLVRNKQKKMYCAGCSMWVLTEEEARLVKHTPEEAGEDTAVAGRSAQAASMHTNTHPPDVTPPAATTAEPACGGDTLSDASSVILEKLADAAAHLRDIPISDSSRCEAYVALIRSCGAALGELQALGIKHRRMN